MHLFFDPNITPEHKEFSLSEEESKHACRVLRLKTGDQFQLLDGKGNLYLTTIISDNPKRCTVRITSVENEKAPSYSVHIAIAPTKNMDRLEWFVEKATEIGATEISLISCSKSERKNVNDDRVTKILVSATKQSKRLYIPKFNSLQPLKSFIDSHPNGLIAHCYDEDKNSIGDIYKPNDCPIIIGPEGDFSPEEVKYALKNGYKNITLGENRLRTETAGLVACMQAIMVAEKKEM